MTDPSAVSTVLGPAWEVGLELAKVVITPIATVAGAFLVAVLGIRGFKHQKIIERRLDWHERLHRAIEGTADSYARAAYANRINATDAGEKWKAANEEAKRLTAIVGESWLYASQEAFGIVDQLQKDMMSLHTEYMTDSATLSEEAKATLMHASAALSAAVRKELGIPELVINVYRDERTGRLELRGS